MATSSPYRAWDVVVVPFPYADRMAEKRRPALVISAPPLHAFGLLWVAMITSADNEPWSCDVPVADLGRAGLPAASVVRPAKVACIEPSRVVRRAGHLAAPNARAVAGRLRQYVAGVASGAPAQNTARTPR